MTHAEITLRLHQLNNACRDVEREMDRRVAALAGAAPTLSERDALAHLEDTFHDLGDEIDDLRRRLSQPEAPADTSCDCGGDCNEIDLVEAALREDEADRAAYHQAVIDAAAKIDETIPF